MKSVRKPARTVGAVDYAERSELALLNSDGSVAARFDVYGASRSDECADDVTERVGLRARPVSTVVPHYLKDRSDPVERDRRSRPADPWLF